MKLIGMITGILSIIIGGILLVSMDNFLFLILIIAGIILLFPTKDHTKKFKLFLKSFKFNKIVFLTLIIDAIYWVIFFILLKGTHNLIENKTSTISLAAFTAGGMQSLAIVKQVIISVFLILMCSLLLLLILYSLAKYPIWALLLKKKINKKQWLKFFFLNLLWWLLWVPLSYILITGLKTELIRPITIILIVLYIFMTTMLHYTMLKTGSIKKSYARGIGFLAMIPKFLQPASCAAILYFLLLGIIWVVSKFITPPGMLLHAILFILYIVWLRYYLKTYIEVFKV